MIEFYRQQDNLGLNSAGQCARDCLALINEVNQRGARLVLRWATVFGFNSRCRTFISVCNQLATQGQLSRPSLRGW